MAYCTVIQVRDSSKKLETVADVPDLDITNRIAEAEKQIKADLSGVISEAALDALGSGSSIINLMAIYKSTEKTLIDLFGIYRKATEIGDIDYFAEQYKNLLDKILDGDIVLVDAGGIAVGSVDFPKITDSDNNLKLYPRKGVSGFIPDGADGSYEDDRIK